ncbi:MAG: hypothetical protein P9L94_09740 [Candidatus Hinthialibacter antarcticus]|nr:hypothetical protein [Candidatus Hinthialibacter antarcticus]
MVLIASACGLFLVAAVFFLLTRSLGKKNFSQAILVDLGLAKSWSKEQESPFYKWGWRKSANDRVWGERIVKQAFERQGVWLNSDDLRFFEDLCNRHATGEKVDENGIRKQIQNIIDRRGRMANCATIIIKKMLSEIANTSESQARKVMSDFGVRINPGNTLGQYGTFRFRQLMTNVGKTILASGSGGFPVKNEQNETLYTLQGLEGWRHWVFACRDEFKKYSPSGSGEVKKSLQALKSRALNTILQEAMEDLQGASEFIAKLENEVYKNGLQYDAQKIEILVSYFYGWQFADGIAFNRTDHRKIREFLLRNEISPVFRSRVLAKINSGYESLRIVLNQFPKRVIFYGTHAQARHYVCQNYLAHLVELFSAVSSIMGRGYMPPSHLLVKGDDVKAARQYWEQMKGRSELERQSDRNTDIHYRRDYIPEMIEKQKEFSLFERDIDDENGETYGYLIDMGVDELTVAESAHLDKGVFRRYLRILCNPNDSVDFEGDSDKAKNSRKDFFSTILLSIEDNPLLRTGSSVGDNEEEEENESQEESTS